MSMFQKYAMFASMMGFNVSNAIDYKKGAMTKNMTPIDLKFSGPAGRFLNQRQKRKLDRQVPQRLRSK